MSVSILMVRALIQALELAGVRRDELVTAAELESHQIDDSNARLSVADYARVQLAALRLSGDEALGLHIGERMSSAAFDVLGHLTEHAATLRQGIETLTRYSRIAIEGPGTTLREEGDTAWICHALPIGVSVIRMPSELAMTGLLRLIRIFVGSDARPRGVYFEYEAPAYRSEYTRIFAGAERFEHGFTGIEIERAWLDRTQLHQSPELYTVLQTQADRALGRLARDALLAELVAAHLASHHTVKLPTMDEVAREFGMSARSMRRRLTTEGAAYNDLVERALGTVAKRLLEDPQASIQEIAHSMGFATPAAFHRAFKRWTGMTPKEYKTSY